MLATEALQDRCGEMQTGEIDVSKAGGLESGLLVTGPALCVGCEHTRSSSSFSWNRKDFSFFSGVSGAGVSLRHSLCVVFVVIVRKKV